MSNPLVACILAVNKVGTIGHEGRIPWELPDDLARFKRITSGNTIVIGRRTHDSIQELRGRALVAHDKKVKAVWDWFDVERAKVEADVELKSGRKQRAIAKLAWARDESLKKIHPVYDIHSLPNRKTIVVGRSLTPQTCNPDLAYVDSPEAALALWRDGGQGNLYCAGGAELYAAFWPHMQLLHLTIVEDDTEGDTKFHVELPGPEWRLAATQRMARKASEETLEMVLSHTFYVLQRKVQRT